MSTIKELTLYSFFYSSAAFRIRSVLAYKKIPFKYETVHLLNGEQHSEEFLKIGPMHQVPVIKVELNNGETHVLSQSLSIIQYLEEMYPENPIYPKDPILRAKSNAIADTISGGIQPLQNHETLMRYVEPLGQEPLDADTRKKVAQFWIGRKLENLENLVKKTAGLYCVGDSVTIADVALVPQMFNARRFEVDTNRFPVLKAIDERLQKMDMFKKAHPLVQPDTPENLRITIP